MTSGLSFTADPNEYYTQGITRPAQIGFIQHGSSYQVFLRGSLYRAPGVTFNSAFYNLPTIQMTELVPATNLVMHGGYMEGAYPNHWETGLFQIMTWNNSLRVVLSGGTNPHKLTMDGISWWTN